MANPTSLPPATLECCEIRHADCVQRDRIIRTAPYSRRDTWSADRRLLPEAAADGRLRLDSDYFALRRRRSGNVYSGRVRGRPIRRVARPRGCGFPRPERPPRPRHLAKSSAPTYKAFAPEGLITSGAGRDLDQVEARWGFPCSRTARFVQGYRHIPEINRSVRVGGVTIQPGICSMGTAMA